MLTFSIYRLLLPRLSHLAMSALLLACSHAALALPEDRNQPVQLKANSAELDDRKGVSVYIGQVHIKQGSMEIFSDKATIYSDDQGIKQIIATGNPVRFKQKPAVDKPWTHGRSLIMEYHADIDRVILKEEAELTQAEDRFKGDRIQLDIESDVVTATSKGKQQGSQVEMFLPPRNKDNN